MVFEFNIQRFVWIALVAFYMAHAAPASRTPVLMLGTDLNNVSAHRAPAIPYINSALSLFTQNYSEPVMRYRVPNTHTTLFISLVRSQPIAKSAMGRTILSTQSQLRNYIRMYDAQDKPLRRGQDPYESDERYTGCFVGVATWPPGSQLMTYGMVYDVLQGLWLFMYREDRLMTAVFEVRDDQFGAVGIGKLQPHRPD